MNRLHQIISDLFSSEKAGLVVGYEKGTGEKRRPAIISNPVDTERLVFDEKCSHNLAVYLTKPEFKQYNKVAVLTTHLTARSIIRLAGKTSFRIKK
ncbi:MAG: hypothetical protein QM786_17170 [Breznakibacter sp.]